jgi:hypothetical protein
MVLFNSWMPGRGNGDTIHCFPLHFIVAIIGVDFVKKVLFRVFYHFDLVLVIDEIAAQLKDISPTAAEM